MPSFNTFTTPRLIFSSIVSVAAGLFLSVPHAAHAEGLKVAFIGDQGVAQSARRVLELIRDEGTELLLIQGDLGYDENSAAQWIENIDGILGENFPVLMVVGNHENFEWPTYLQWQKDKLERVSEINCEGDISVKAYCTYKDIGVVQVSPGIKEVEGINGSDNYPDYIRSKFTNDTSTWRICSWHKNMRDMQAGGKGDSTGWGVYQQCLAQGGIVVNGHEHSYSRTHLMSSFEAKTVIHTNSDMDIGPNSSIAIVSGLGGRQIRPQLHGGDWFAAIYTSSQNANDGALFCDFNDDKAECYMKDVAGLVPDTFTLTSRIQEQDSADMQSESDEQNDDVTEDDNGEQNDASEQPVVVIETDEQPTSDTQADANEQPVADNQPDTIEQSVNDNPQDTSEQPATDAQPDSSDQPVTEAPQETSESAPSDAPEQPPTDTQADATEQQPNPDTQTPVETPVEAEDPQVEPVAQTPLTPQPDAPIQPAPPVQENPASPPQSAALPSDDETDPTGNNPMTPSSAESPIPTAFANNEEVLSDQPPPSPQRNVTVDGGGSLSWLSGLVLITTGLWRRVRRSKRHG